MYGLNHPRRYGRYKQGNMILRNLPNPRWALFGIASVSYFIITIYILSFSQESCPQKENLYDVARDTDKVPEDAETLKLNSNRLEKIIDAEYEEKSEKHQVKVTGRKFNLGPLGKEVVILEKTKQTTQSTSKLYTPDALSAQQLLNPNMAPNTIFMVWCGKRWFEFHNYMSVLSAIKHLRPDNIIFYYDHHPIIDYWLYNTWFDELRAYYPFFQPEQLPANSYACAGHELPNVTFIANLLTARGGMYLNEHTIFASYPLNLRFADFVYAFDPNTMYGFISAKRGLPGKYKVSQILESKRLNATEVTCVSMGTYNQLKHAPICVLAPDVFYPKEIWEEPSKFSRLIRMLFYGSPEPIDAKPSSEELIPNIAHIVWIGGGRMDYLFYLGVLSLLYVAEVEMVYIHGDGPPSGELWERIKDNPRIKHIYREVPRSIYGQNVKVWSHVSDIWRVDFMVRYGGIYVDTDTVFVKKLDREIRSYDAVGAYDWTYWNHPFPDTINFGVAIGKRNATYWHEFQKTMKWFIDDDWAWNGLRQPYKIKERRPDIVKINPHLQVICYQYLCHPTWWPDYHNESIHHMNSPSIRNWRNDTYVFHWTLPTPPELDNEELLMTSQTMAAEVGRNVLEKAGLLGGLKAKYSKTLLDPNKNHHPVTNKHIGR